MVFYLEKKGKINKLGETLLKKDERIKELKDHFNHFCFLSRLQYKSRMHFSDSISFSFFFFDFDFFLSKFFRI